MKKSKFAGWLWIAALLLLIPLVSRGEIFSVSPGDGAIGEALAACSDGDIIELRDGIYTEAEETFPLTVSKSVTLRAAEGAEPVIEAPAMAAALRIEADGVTVEGLDIRFRRTGIYAVGNDLTVERCRFTLADEKWRVTSCGMWFGGIYRTTLRDCAFTGCNIAMAGPPLSERSASLPKLTGMFEVGEDPEYFTTHTIENCTVNGKPLFYAVSLPSVTAPADAGEIVCCGCGEVTVRDADCSDGSMGIMLIHNEYVTIENCEVSRCGIFGTYVAKCGGGIIADCYSEGTNHAFDNRADSHLTLRNCTAAACEQGMFFSSVTDSVMTGCRAFDTRQGYFIGTGSGNILIGCLASGCENGFHIEKEGHLLMTSCTAEKCSVCGVRVDRSPLAFVHSTLRENWVGMIAYGGFSLDIAGNLIENNENCGLSLRNIGFSRIAGNRFTGSGTYSAVFAGTAENSIWTGNETDVLPDFSGVTDGVLQMD